MVESFAGKVFRGSLHPVELTSRLVREADLALATTEIGPLAPNVFEVRVGPIGTPDEIPDGMLDGCSRPLSPTLLAITGGDFTVQSKSTLLEDDRSGCWFPCVHH